MFTVIEISLKTNSTVKINRERNFEIWSDLFAIVRHHTCIIYNQLEFLVFLSYYFILWLDYLQVSLLDVLQFLDVDPATIMASLFRSFELALA